MCNNCPTSRGLLLGVFFTPEVPGLRWDGWGKQTKGQSEATAFPANGVTQRGSRSAEGKLFLEMLMEFPAASQRLYGEVTYKTVGVGAICSVFARLGVHALVCVFLFSAAGFLGRTVTAFHSVLLVKRTHLQTDIAHMMSDVLLAVQNRKRQLNPGFYHF